MAEFGNGNDYALISQVDMSAAQYRCVIAQSGTSNTMQIASAAADPVIGIVQTKPQSGEAGRVRVNGISKVVAGGTVETGDALETNATGFAILALNSGRAFGRALSDAASGGIFTAVIRGTAGV